MHLAAIQQIDVRRTAFCLRRVIGFTQPQKIDAKYRHPVHRHHQRLAVPAAPQGPVLPPEFSVHAHAQRIVVRISVFFSGTGTDPTYDLLQVGRMQRHQCKDPARLF